ncbi:MAG: 2-hydroxychromene-2-carboxylate isomerase [Caulobacterales bacterium]|jgi:2-hydroxychromene-2-carboxylate isomerase|nr:2-hydroxychromene-2-carboxylate isomerase [Caulobacterales bacterium]
MAALEFYFDYRSPYSYLAQTQVRRLGIEIDWRPFEILQLMDQVGNVPTSITCKPKGKYLGVDLMRWVAMYKVPFGRHPQAADIDGRRLLRATLAAAELGQADAAVAAIFGAYWGRGGAPLSTPGDLVALLAGVGVSGPGLAARIDDPALDAALDEATRAAAERGVFGAPTMYVGDEMFFGNDRMDFVRANLGLAA